MTSFTHTLVTTQTEFRLRVDVFIAHMQTDVEPLTRIITVAISSFQQWGTGLRSEEKGDLH